MWDPASKQTNGGFKAWGEFSAIVLVHYSSLYAGPWAWFQDERGKMGEKEGRQGTQKNITLKIRPI